MLLLLAFCIQLAGFLILYSTSARAVFVKRKLNSWFYKYLYFSKALGSLMLLASSALCFIELGTGVGFFFVLLSLMTISGFIVILLPLQKPKAQRH